MSGTLKTSFRTSEMLEAMRPFISVCKMHGLTPYRLSARGKSISCSVMHLVYAAVLTLLHAAALTYHIYLITTTETKKHGNIEDLTSVVSCTLYAISGTAALMDLCFNNKNYRKIVSLMARCDDTLLTRYWRGKWSARRIVWAELAVVGVAEAANVAACFPAASALDALLLLADVGCATVVWLSTLKLVNVVLVVRSGLVCLNERLPSLRARSLPDDNAMDCWGEGEPDASGREQSEWVATGYRSRAAGVRSLRRAYHALSELAEAAVAAHQLCALLTLLATLANSILLAYRVSRDGNEVALGVVASAAHNLGLFLALAVPAHAAATEGSRTGRLVSQLLLDEPLRTQPEAEMRLFAHQVTSTRPTFCIFGTVTLDLNLLASFISTLTTYTVLLLTFKYE